MIALRTTPGSRYNLVVQATKLRGMAIVAGLLALAMIPVACMQGRLVIYVGNSTTLHEFEHVSAGGLVGALHGAALVVLAVRLWHKPSLERAWFFTIMAGVLELATRGIDAIVWMQYKTSPTLTGRIYNWLELAVLAIGVVVLPLALLLARRSSDTPRARIVAE